MKGLLFRKTADAIASFVKEHGGAGPRRAVLCTYDLDPDRFEAVVLPELARRGRWFRTLVLADGAAVQKDGVLTRRSEAATYELAPVRLKGPGVFHPKLLVLQAGDRMLVGVGSANLTPGGLGGNLELMLLASSETREGGSLAASAVQFLDDLRQSDDIALPATARRFLDRVCASTSHARGGPVLHSLYEPLMGQMKRNRPAKVDRVAVLSPWHSSAASPAGVEPDVLRELGRALGGRPIVHTEGQGTKGPALGHAIPVRVLRSQTLDDDALETDGEDDRPRRTRRPARLHAKAYLAAGNEGATLWFGSANCTTPALRRAVRDGGNVELLIRLALAPSNRAAFESDLDSMFDDKKGDLQQPDKARIEAPRGIVLAGRLSRAKEPTLTLELVAPSTRARTVRIARQPRRAGATAIPVPAGRSLVPLEARSSAAVLQ